MNGVGVEKALWRDGGFRALVHSGVWTEPKANDRPRVSETGDVPVRQVGAMAAVDGGARTATVTPPRTCRSRVLAAGGCTAFSLIRHAARPRATDG